MRIPEYSPGSSGFTESPESTALPRPSSPLILRSPLELPHTRNRITTIAVRSEASDSGDEAQSHDRRHHPVVTDHYCYQRATSLGPVRQVHLQGNHSQGATAQSPRATFFPLWSHSSRRWWSEGYKVLQLYPAVARRCNAVSRARRRSLRFRPHTPSTPRPTLKLAVRPI